MILCFYLWGNASVNAQARTRKGPYSLLYERAPDWTADKWYNTGGKSLTPDKCRGKVVLLQTWSYGSYSSRNTIPWLQQWHEQYGDRGLQVIGIHTPEYEAEKKARNVEAQVVDLGITYPVGIDNEYKTWKRFANRYWPTVYLIDAEEIIRHIQVGDGYYDVMEEKIRKVLEIKKEQ